MSGGELQDLAADLARQEWPRMTPTQRLHEVTMAALMRPHAEPESAVEITRNAKGDYQFTVTVRGFDVADCLVQAQATARALAELYPRDE